MVTVYGQNMAPVSKTNPWRDPHPLSPIPPPFSPRGETVRGSGLGERALRRRAQSKAVILICPASEISRPHCFNCFNGRGNETLAYRGILGINLSSSIVSKKNKNLSPLQPPSLPSSHLIPANTFLSIG